MPIIDALIERWCVSGNGYSVLEERLGVKAIQSMSRPWTFGFSRGRQ